MANQTQQKALSDLQALIAGTEKHTPNGTFTVNNTPYTTASLLQVLQTLVTALSKLLALVTDTKDAREALAVVEAQVTPIVDGYKDLLLAQYGNASTTLADYGLKPKKKKAKLTTVAQAEAQAKAKSTREARGTKGPKAKLAIKGAVAPAVESAATPAEITPPATPAVPPAKPAV